MTKSDRYSLDPFHSAKTILINSKKNGNTDMLLTYIKDIVFPLFEEHGLEKSKTFDGIIETINSFINENKQNIQKLNFYEDE